MIKLTATLIEICENPGYAMLRWQLATKDGSATSGDMVSTAIELHDMAEYEVGKTYDIQWGVS